MIKCVNLLFKDDYQDEHDTQLIPVKINDVVFGLHAVFACIVTIIQCFIYEVSRFTMDTKNALMLIEI